MVKIKVMLPYYNDLTVLLSSIFKSLDFDIVYVGRPTKKTIKIAVENSPENWCFDTKLLLGQLIECGKLRKGLLIAPGAWGGRNENCVLGYLTEGVMQKYLEKNLNRKVDLWFFNINCVEIFYSGYSSVIRNIKTLKKYYKKRGFYKKAFSGFYLGLKKMRAMNKLKEHLFSSYDVEDKQLLLNIYEQFVRDMIFKADTICEAEKIYEESRRKIGKLKRKKVKNKIKIGIVGDFSYTLFSFHPIFNIEEFLIKEDIYVFQPLMFYNFFNVLSPLYSKKNREETRKIFPKSVTGSDAITLLTTNYLKNKVDGIIHIGTFGCTPEQIARESLTENKKFFPPILNLSYDSHTTEENMKVRVEAFIDMIKHKKK